MWQERLGLTDAPAVLPTNGSPANVSLLVTGAAEVAVSQLDVAADRTGGQSSLRALAAIYNDALQIVVPAGSAIRAVADLRGARVAIGTGELRRHLRRPARARRGGAGRGERRAARALDLAGSVAALRAGDVDAFFWVGALPTRTVDELAAAVPVRLLDLEPVLGALRGRYPVYTPGTVLAGTYRIDDPVVTLLVRNVLLVDAELDADLVEAMTGAVFAEQQRLADATQAARTVDARSADPHPARPLHDGALRWFSDDAMACSAPAWRAARRRPPSDIRSIAASKNAAPCSLNGCRCPISSSVTSPCIRARSSMNSAAAPSGQRQLPQVGVCERRGGRNGGELRGRPPVEDDLGERLPEPPRRLPDLGLGQWGEPRHGCAVEQQERRTVGQRPCPEGPARRQAPLAGGRPRVASAAACTASAAAWCASTTSTVSSASRLAK